VSRRSEIDLGKSSLQRYRVRTSAYATKMSYNILKSFWELLAPQPIRKPTPDPIMREHPDYDEIIAVNEANEIVVLHLPKKYSLSYL
jgi:hypothetical protein